MDETIINRIKESLLHVKVKAVTFDGGMPLFTFDKSKLFVASTWRIVYNGNIVASSDSEEIDNKTLNILNGKSIQQVSIMSPLLDLRIEFSDGLSLETFSTSVKYEHWNLIGGEHAADMIIAGPDSSSSAF